jgi:hypothetical protein
VVVAELSSELDEQDSPEERLSEHSVVSCETERVRRGSVVLECTSVINPVINPNPVYSH